MLKVPYIVQNDVTHCGGAALEMVFKHLKNNKVTQDEIFEKYKNLEPHDTGNFRIKTDDLVAEARLQGFRASVGKDLLMAHADTRELLDLFINKLKLPIIVCQQFPQNPLLGHFRVVTGFENDVVTFHDPHPQIGGRFMKMSLVDFIAAWQPTGNNVTGGIYIWVRKPK